MGHYAQIDELNRQFESSLIDACKINLRPGIDPYQYAEVVLNDLWTEETYIDDSGAERYYEISKIDTAHGRPVVIHTP